MSALTELSKMLTQKTKETTAVSTVWATVQSVDWDEKTCVCTGLLDDLEYYDVLLGIGDVYTKPQTASKVL